MSQPQYDPIITPLSRKWNILTSCAQEVADFLPIIVAEIQRLRQENADLKKLLEDKKHGEEKTT